MSTMLLLACSAYGQGQVQVLQDIDCLNRFPSWALVLSSSHPRNHCSIIRQSLILKNIWPTHRLRHLYTPNTLPQRIAFTSHGQAYETEAFSWLAYSVPDEG